MSFTTLHNMSALCIIQSKSTLTTCIPPPCATTTRRRQQHADMSITQCDDGHYILKGGDTLESFLSKVTFERNLARMS